MKHLKLKPHNIFAALILFFSFTAQAKFAERDARFLFQAGTYDFTATSKTSKGSVSGFGSFTFALEYAFLDQFAANVSYNYLKSDGIGGDTSTGIDVAMKWYPVTYSGYKHLENGPLELSITQLFRPYVGFALRQREFVLVLTTNYIGYGFFAGVDYQLHEQWFLNFEYRMDMYFGGSQDAEADMTNIVLGVGYQF